MMYKITYTRRSDRDPNKWTEYIEVLALRPAMERNVQRRREVEARKAETALRKRVEEESRKALLNMALYRAGIPFQVM